MRASQGHLSRTIWFADSDRHNPRVPVRSFRRLDGLSSVFVTGRGDSQATADTGGLILKESTRQHAEGMSAAAFRHGPLEMAGKNVLVLIIEGYETTVSPFERRVTT